MNRTVHQYDTKEVEAALNILDIAIENHRLWFDNLHISILCKQPFADDILNKAAHTQCQFGKWYYGNVSESIKSIQAYTELEQAHKTMHHMARELAESTNKESGINHETYKQFLHNQHHLIDLLTCLRDTLIQHEHCFDGLTGAVNRKSISLLLDQSFENARRNHHTYSIAMLDIDYFKKINDTYGHTTGDQVLKYFTRYFRKALRKSDCIGRYGGEEFLIFLPDTSQENAFEIMDKIRHDLSNEIIRVDTSTLSITTSVGISELLINDANAWQAVERADRALYDAKKAGRNKSMLSKPIP